MTEFKDLNILEEIGEGQRVFLSTNNLYCEVNSFYLTKLRQFIEHNGHSIVESADEATKIVLVGCGFDVSSDDSFREMIRTSEASLLEGQQLILSGCWPGMHPEFGGQDSVVTPVPSWEESKLDDLFSASISFGDIHVNHIDASLIENYGQLFSPGESGEAFIQVAEGCGNNCTYCFIKRARGALRSQPVETIVRQYQDIRRNGKSRIVLLSDDFGSYGLDIGTTGADLLQELHRVDPVGRFSINYLNPYRLIQNWDKYREVFAAGLITSINIPVQSASNRVLKLMNRMHTAEEIFPIIREIRRISPRTRIITHAMVGFPTATYAEFVSTLANFLEHFDSVAYFTYGDRPGVKSYDIVPKVPQEDLERRVNLLTRMADALGDRLQVKPSKGFQTTVLASELGTTTVPILAADEASFNDTATLVPPSLVEEPASGSSPEGSESQEPEMEPAVLASILLEKRGFVFAVTALEAALRRFADSPKSEPIGLSVHTLEPMIAADEIGFRFLVDLHGHASELRVFPASDERAAYYDGKQLQVSYPSDAAIEPQILDTLRKEVFAPVDRYVDGVLATASPDGE